jgi:hypothetical protein
LLLAAPRAVATEKASMLRARAIKNMEIKLIYHVRKWLSGASGVYYILFRINDVEYEENGFIPGVIMSRR